MSRSFEPGDFLVFQLEAGFALLRVLAADEGAWHLAAYSDFYPDVETAEAAAKIPDALRTSLAHVALTDRAFESTQVAKIGNAALSDDELVKVDLWRDDPERQISDRSIRLLLGLR